MTPRTTQIEFSGWFRGTLVDTPTLRADAFCEPLDGFCGDFIGLYRPAPSVIIGAIADACGHGAKAAALLQTASDAGGQAAPLETSPAAQLEVFGARVAAAGGADDGKFITAMVFRLDVRSGLLTVALAGHPPPVLIRHGSIVTESWPTGLPIGIDSTIGAEDITIQLAPGDALVAYTDGVADARPAGGMPLGFDSASAMLARAARSADPVASALSSLGAGQPIDWQADDTTAIFIRLRGLDFEPETPRGQAWTPPRRS